MPWPPERPQIDIPRIGDGRTALRIGIISDTHVPEARRELWPQVFDAFAGVDAILHGGDIHDIALIDRFETLAPTFSARGNGEEGSGSRAAVPADPRLREAWRLRLGELNVGIVHDLPVPEIPPKWTVANTMREQFHVDPDGPDALDVIIHGDSHVERVDLVGRVLCVNPGSPTYPRNFMTRLGIIGFLDIDGRKVRTSLCQLTEDGYDTVITHEHDFAAVK
ncbi:MAG: phosphodiesterase, family [Pseudonocardiales bacterium]|nr:phosphodiesterase, family [Jatrophihabitantaceae bacterium]MCW2604353.1 phosphodiesterase, family [Pseudonocardiales bacterium]